MKKLAALVVVLSAFAMAWSWSSHDAGDPKLVFDRFWIDHQPRGQHEAFQALWMNGEYPYGRVGPQSQWKGSWEGFRYVVVSRNSGDVDLTFPASNLKEHVNFRATKCNEKGFDYCLDVKGSSRAARRYYSRREWRNATGDADALNQLMAPALDPAQ